MSLPRRSGDRFDPNAWGDERTDRGDEPTSVSSRRPGTVLAGCILAWVGSAAGIYTAVVLLTASQQSGLYDGLSADQRLEVASVYRLVGILNLIWCPIVILAALFAFRRAKWAAITLVLMAVVWILVNIFNALAGGGFGVVLGVVWTTASVTLVYFLRPSREWYAART